MSSRPAAAVAAIALAVSVVGCGGGGSGAHPGATPGRQTAAEAAVAQALIARSFGPNPAAGSGMIAGEIDVAVTGVPRFSAPVALTMSGPFSQAAPGAAPEAHIALGISVPKGIIGADMILTGNQVLFELGSTAYRIPPAVAAPIRAPLAGAGNALTAVLGVLHLAPQRWGTRPRVVGQEKVDDTPVVHLTDRINVTPFFRDAAGFAAVLKALRATDLALLPSEITPAARAALVRSVTSATGNLYIGSADHVVRRAKLKIELKPSPADRKLLGGIATMRIVANLHVTEVGSRPAVVVPTNLQPYAELKLLLDDLAASARTLAAKGKF